MTDINNIAKSYIELWNERIPSRRREMLATAWTADASYVDPLMKGEGHDGIDALIEGHESLAHYHVAWYEAVSAKLR